MLALCEHRKGECEHGRWKRRHRLEVVACILQEALDWATKTRLVYRTNLNFKVLSKYLDFLMAKGLIEHKRFSRLNFYKTTQKGRMWLSLYVKLTDPLGDS